MNVLVFDIQTIPDIDGGQKIYNLHGLDDESTAKALFHLRKQQSGTRELAYHLQQIAAISIVYRGIDENMDRVVTVNSLGDENSSEAQLLTTFFEKIETRTPTLVSWNGSGFALPTIHYRALKNKVSAPSYWETGANDSNFHHDNYLSRYHDRHTDLMDVLASYRRHAAAPLNEIALMLGFPDVPAQTLENVWEQHQQQGLTSIRHQSQTRALNTYLIYLQFQRIRGVLTEAQLEEEFSLLREHLEVSETPHLQQFTQQWAR